MNHHAIPDRLMKGVMTRLKSVEQKLAGADNVTTLIDIDLLHERIITLQHKLDELSSTIEQHVSLIEERVDTKLASIEQKINEITASVQSESDSESDTSTDEDEASEA